MVFIPSKPSPSHETVPLKVIWQT